MATRTHVVRAGECVASIAAREGLTVEEVWDLGENAALRRRRGSPYILKAGDLLRLPQRSRGAATLSRGATHTFEAEVPTVRLTVSFVRHDEEPREPRERSAVADTAVRVEVAGRTIETTTNRDGLLEVDVPATARRAKVALRPDTPTESRFVFTLGGLDPHGDDEGALHRLRNLGFAGWTHQEGPVTRDELAAAVRAFQRWAGITPTGALDAETADALLSAHGA